MGCFSLLNIYEPKSLGLFIKFQPIMRQMNFFIPPWLSAVQTAPGIHIYLENATRAAYRV